MEAKVIANHEVCLDQDAEHGKLLPAQPRPGIKPRKSYTRPQITFELDMPAFPVCWWNPPPGVTLEIIYDGHTVHL
jgi:hypothetical protein